MEPKRRKEKTENSMKRTKSSLLTTAFNKASQVSYMNDVIDMFIVNAKIFLYKCCWDACGVYSVYYMLYMTLRVDSLFMKKISKDIFCHIHSK